jgi:alpha-beta hydrolase superfamily lysophospholipase
MIRFLLAVLAAYLLALGAAASAAPIDQGGWNARKQKVRLANRITLAYVELGDPKGEPLLLLHGYTDTSRSWTQVAPWLLRHRLLVPDQRGHAARTLPPAAIRPASWPTTRGCS